MPDPESASGIDLLPYAPRLERRALSDIDLVVIHCTELPDLATARTYGERVLYAERDDGHGGTGNSGHFYIDRDGSVHCWVGIDRVAHHTRGYNPRSIGIELVNRGRWPNWLDSRHQGMDEPYTEAQIVSLVRLLLEWQSSVPSLRFIAGHEDLDMDAVQASDDPALQVRRKRDPGPLFPWERVLRSSSLQRMGAT